MASVNKQCAEASDCLFIWDQWGIEYPLELVDHWAMAYFKDIQFDVVAIFGVGHHGRFLKRCDDRAERALYLDWHRPFYLWCRDKLAL